jgi:hypothetical protein
MSRPVATRANYRTDAAFLLRLEEAIERDPNQDDKWKSETGKMVRELAQKLLTAKQKRVEKAASRKPATEAA